MTRTAQHVRRTHTPALLCSSLLAAMLGACADGAPEEPELGGVQLESRCRPATTPNVELASFCQRWDQFPSGQIRMDIGMGPMNFDYKLLGIGNRTGYVEGDIVIGDENSIEQVRRSGGQVGPTEGVARISHSGRWHNGHVTYVIDPYLPSPQRVRDAIAHWEARTSLRFHERTNETDYIRFQDGGGCSSWVGRVGGEQAVTLNAACSVGNAIHEIGHAIGLWHEQSRTDRDDFVTIDFDNVIDGYEGNFEIITDPGTENGNVAFYNFGSIMHYPPTAFAVDPARPTITVRPEIRLLPGTVVGQRNGLSQGDVTAATLLYCEEEDFACVIPTNPYL